MIDATPLRRTQHILLSLIALLIVGFGQPVWGVWPGIAAALIGFALFWRVLLDYPNLKTRFWLATAWFTAVQLIQLYWMVSHPYAYIYFAYLFFAFAKGLQFGVLGIFMTPQLLDKWIRMLGFAALWVFMEWGRLFFMAGYSWNPIGLAWTGSEYALQGASLFGVFGLSFWVILTNLLVLRAWVRLPALVPLAAAAVAAALPFIFGTWQVAKHQEELSSSTRFKALLVQTAFPAEEALGITDLKQYVSLVMDSWNKILNLLGKHKDEKVELIVLPEYVVPLGTYSFVYPYELVKNSFTSTFGKSALKKLPPLEMPLAKQVETVNGPIWAVNNAYWSQTLANLFDAPLVVGLEDAEDIDGIREHYSAAIYFTPMAPGDEFLALRYVKRVLVPMGEYIPFSFCRALAANYGIQGSFTSGTMPGIFTAGSIPFGVSICYEETFGHLMRESRREGAQLLVNLTSDVWFPNSTLPYAHLEHSRLRTVENGVPMLRACNTGITSAFDSLGRTVSIYGDTPYEKEWRAGCLAAEVPLYTHSTLYSHTGDHLIVGICLCFLLLWSGFSLLKIDPLF